MSYIIIFFFKVAVKYEILIKLKYDSSVNIYDCASANLNVAFTPGGNTDFIPHTLHTVTACEQTNQVSKVEVGLVIV